MLQLLIVDDDPIDREKVNRSLVNIKSEIQEADSCEAGLEKVKNHSFDLILLDYHLPDGTGIDLLYQIRALHITTPIVLVTAYSKETPILAAVQEDLLDCVSKDQLNPEILMCAVANALMTYKDMFVDQEFFINSSLDKIKQILTISASEITPSPQPELVAV